LSDVLLVSSDGLSSPSIKIKPPYPNTNKAHYSWGFSWYPNDNLAAIIAKDPASKDSEVLTNALTDRTRFRSSTFMAKTKDHAKGDSYHEVQPFSRSFAGRDWTFVHNGNLDKSKLEKLFNEKSHFLEPLGTTDSELAFCYLISKLADEGARKLSGLSNKKLQRWFKELDGFGGADIAISDGSTMACYHGTNAPQPLYYSRLQPPEHPTYFESDFAWFDLSDPRDIYRTYFILSSRMFHMGYWFQMQPGQLFILKKGTLVWDSLSNQHHVPQEVELVAEESSSKNQKSENYQSIKNFDSVQPSQPQFYKSVVNARSITHTSRGKPLTYRMFDISHTTTYRYAQPVERSTHTFRLQPMEDPTQEVLTSNLTISSLGEEIRYEDVFGNQAIHYIIDEPYTDLTIECVSRVKIYAKPPIDLNASVRRSVIPLVWMPWQRQMLLPYRQPPELPETQLRELTQYAMSFVERNDCHPMKTLKDMNLTIYKDYSYYPGSTSLNTTPFEVYSSRRGVCQDFANLLICLARLLNIPARYRMGYIYTGTNYANKIQSDASHAWAEIYLPYIGWIGFDPTNGCMVNQDHIRVACGRHYIDATPTDGTIYKGGSAEYLNVDVKMTEIHR
jgi:transglutaminase-like putative cysteine protease/predicted glutamine amidotransferase